MTKANARSLYAELSVGGLDGRGGQASDTRTVTEAGSESLDADQGLSRRGASTPVNRLSDGGSGALFVRISTAVETQSQRNSERATTTFTKVGQEGTDADPGHRSRW